VHDPYFSNEEVMSLGLEPSDDLASERVDAIVVQAWHNAYADLDFAAFRGCRAVLDGRNSLDRASVEAAGMIYLGVGR
jgi:hypothetical protein